MASSIAWNARIAWKVWQENKSKAFIEATDKIEKMDILYKTLIWFFKLINYFNDLFVFIQ